MLNLMSRIPRGSIVLSALVSILPVIAFAQGNVSTLCNIIGNVANLVAVFGTIILIIAFVVLLYAAFLFITGAGNEEAIKKAKSFIIYALIGLAVALLAIFADDILMQLFGGNFLQGCASTNPFQ